MLRVGVVEDPEQSPHWPEIQRLLRPAADRGGCDEIIGENELCWACLADGEVIGAATARLTVEKVCEVVLVGGVRRHLWLEALDKAIGACAAEAGATRMRAMGRRGWGRDLERLGWARIGERDGVVAYERGLR